MRSNRLLIASAAAIAVALPALAQNAVAPKPAGNTTAPQPQPQPQPAAPAPGNEPAATPDRAVTGPSDSQTGIVDAGELELPE